MAVVGVIVGSGGVTNVVGIVVTGDGRGWVGLGVIVGVPGVGTLPGGETVPVTGGGEGTGILTAGGGENGAAAVTGAAVVVPDTAGRVAGVGDGEAGAGVNPADTFPADGWDVTAVPVVAVVAGIVCACPGAPADALPVGGTVGAVVVPGGVIWGPVHPAARSRITARPARSMILIRSILVPHGT